MNESANLFSSDEDEINFYESHVGRLTPLDIEFGLTLKVLYESNQHFCRLELRRDKLKANLEKYGAEIFNGYARGSLPPSFVLTVKNEILESAKRKKIKIDELGNELCPQRSSGFQKIAANVNGKPRWLAGYPPNMKMFSQARESNYLYQYRSYVCTKWDIYNFDTDVIDDEAKELLAIRHTLHIWKRKKWPDLVLDDLLKEANYIQIFELQQKFERIYFLVLKGGREVKLPRLKFIHQRVL